MQKDAVFVLPVLECDAVNNLVHLKCIYCRDQHNDFWSYWRGML